VINRFNDDAAAHYLSQGTDKLDSSAAQRFLILVLICIGTLLVTLLLVSPVTFKIRRQKYQVLLFFMGLDEDITAACLRKSEKFEEKFSDVNFING
jgi:hypothetical protein